MTPLAPQPGHRSALLDNYSLEMTAKASDIEQLGKAATLLPPATRVNVTFLGNESRASRAEAARAVDALGLTPVPHLAARRLASRDDLLAHLDALCSPARLFLIGGDPAEPLGPFSSALDVIRDPAIAGLGLHEIGIAGYPEGHPEISNDQLDRAYRDKLHAIEALGATATITTQFAFDSVSILRWVERMRGAGIEVPIRIGVPGPAGVRRLLGFARRFGVGSSAGIVKKYGFSLTSLLGTAGPERLLDALADGYEPATHGDLRVHFYAFGGLVATANWVAEYHRNQG